MAKRQVGAGRIVAVVVTHDRLDQLRVTVQRLLESSPDVLQALVVVDNASTDGTARWLADQEDSRLLVYRNKINGGGAGGFEIGMQLAVERFDPEWILVTDDDARPLPGALETFCAKDRSDADAWAAAVFNPDGHICDINRPSINPFWNSKAFFRTAAGGGRNGFHLGLDAYQAKELREVDGASFVGLFVSRSGIARAGFPDGRLFIYGDDVLYTLGLRKAGGRILFDPGLQFEHDFSSVSETRQSFHLSWKNYYHYRNLLIVYRMAAGWLFWPALLVVVPKWILMVRHHQGERRMYLGLVLRAMRDGLLRRTDVPHARVTGWSGR